MRTYWLDRDGDVWATADDGTLVCITDGRMNAQDYLKAGKGLTIEKVQEEYGPLIPLVPDETRCHVVLTPGIVCDYEKHDGRTHHAERPDGTIVEWVTSA